MGVEYQHYFFVLDLAWEPDLPTARRVHEFLDHWSLVSGAPKICSLDEGRTRELNGRIEGMRSLPSNLLLWYPHVTGVPRIEEMMGPSYYPPAEIGERYLQRIMLVLGTDYRLFHGHELAYAELIEPVKDAGKPVKPFHREEAPYAIGEAFPAKPSTRAPKTRLRANRPEQQRLLPEEFTGTWRSGLILDCGKDLPAFAEKTNVLPSATFARELEDAFGTSLSRSATTIDALALPAKTPTPALPSGSSPRCSSAPPSRPRSSGP